MATAVDFYTRVITRLRSWGYAVEEVPGWQSRTTQGGAFDPTLLFVEHHDASAPTTDDGAHGYVVAKKLSQFTISRSGRIRLCAAGVTWHAGVGGPLHGVPRNSANTRSTAVEVANSGSEPYSDACTSSIVALEAAWAIEAGRTAEIHLVVGHKEWATPRGRKVDPAIDMDWRRAAVAAFIAEKSGQPAPAPAPAPALVPVSAPAPASDLLAVPAWTLPAGHYLGDISGPDESHGGWGTADDAMVLFAQRAFIALGCVPGQSNPGSSWADAKWEGATTDACRRWFDTRRPNGAAQPHKTRTYRDDWNILVAQVAAATAPAPAPAPQPAAPAPSGMLRRGSTGVAVRRLQAALKASFPAYRHTCGAMVVDGDFGPTTEKWVREFQRRSGLTVDGIAGPATLGRLGL
ncbi:N-acetylmuramoyl-L-alanine amidase [Modestobacter sp. KNN46-3]|uniref:peptidoglycan recognition protein family protein n=1 Tax=Modestobacter sp. KNN46-3 TaxID=2711218 RepID=UPI0013E0E05C|nr:N-acetylmuramoyl-L-alanine amidase [Modestobacter sp. KNN46-3]